MTKEDLATMEAAVSDFNDNLRSFRLQVAKMCIVLEQQEDAAHKLNASLIEAKINLGLPG
jgi:hypothetical protein